MFLEFVRGLSDAKRWFRRSYLCLRNCGGKNVATSPLHPDNPETQSRTAARESMRSAAEAWGAYAAKHGATIADQRYKDLCE